MVPNQKLGVVEKVKKPAYNVSKERLWDLTVCLTDLIHYNGLIVLNQIQCQRIAYIPR